MVEYRAQLYGEEGESSSTTTSIIVAYIALSQPVYVYGDESGELLNKASSRSDSVWVKIQPTVLDSFAFRFNEERVEPARLRLIYEPEERSSMERRPVEVRSFDRGAEECLDDLGVVKFLKK